MYVFYITNGFSLKEDKQVVYEEEIEPSLIYMELNTFYCLLMKLLNIHRKQKIMHSSVKLFYLIIQIEEIKFFFKPVYT